MTYEGNKQKANELGYPDAACLACGNRSTSTSDKCKKCIAETPEFAEAVNAFMNITARIPGRLQ